MVITIELTISNETDVNTVTSILAQNDYWVKVIPASIIVDGTTATYSDVFTLLVKKEDCKMDDSRYYEDYRCQKCISSSREISCGTCDVQKELDSNKNIVT